MSLIPEALPAFPVSVQSLKIFFTFRKQYEKVECSTMRNDLAVIRHYLGSQPNDPTRTAEFKEFFQGIKREMLAECPPNRKLPTTGDHLCQIMKRMNPEEERDVELCLLMSLGYLGFLRLSELLTLRKCDVRIEKNGLMLTIRRSKTDQTGRGYCCYIERSNRL